MRFLKLSLIFSLLSVPSIGFSEEPPVEEPNEYACVLNLPVVNGGTYKATQGANIEVKEKSYKSATEVFSALNSGISKAIKKANAQCKEDYIGSTAFIVSVDGTGQLNRILEEKRGSPKALFQHPYGNIRYCCYKNSPR